MFNGRLTFVVSMLSGFRVWWSGQELAWKFLWATFFIGMPVGLVGLFLTINDMVSAVYVEFHLSSKAVPMRGCEFQFLGFAKQPERIVDGGGGVFVAPLGKGRYIVAAHSGEPSQDEGKYLFRVKKGLYDVVARCGKYTSQSRVDTTSGGARLYLMFDPPQPL